MPEASAGPPSPAGGAPPPSPSGASPEALAELQAETAEVWHRARASARELAQAVHPRLDPTTYPLVAVLGRAGRMRAGALGAVLQLDKSTVSRQVDAAARLGLVERVPDPEDARARLVSLTPQGRERFEELSTARLERWSGALAAWPAEDVRELTRLLRRLGESGAV